MITTKLQKWIEVAPAQAISEDSGAAVLYEGQQIAVFNYGNDKFYAVQNMCPHKKEMVMARGLLGDQAGVAKVACPMHKKTFSLEDGHCFDGDCESLQTWPVKVVDGIVFLQVES